MIVDAHQHFWSLQRGDYGWLTPSLQPLYRDFLPQDLAPLLSACKVHATVLVQAAPTEAETAFLIELSRRWPFVAGVVGWTDFAACDARQRILALKAQAQEKLKGFRPMLQDIADANWVAQPALDAAFDTLVEAGLSFDALVRPQHLEALERRLDRTAGLRTVIDHCAKPPIAAHGFEAWADALERLARRSNVWCKLSGLLTEAQAGCGRAQLEPYVHCILRCFGPERILWGSDWPVINVVSDYRSWLDMARDLVRSLSPGSEARIFGANAIEFYALSSNTTALLLLSPLDNVAVAPGPLAADTRQWLEPDIIEILADVAAGFKVAVRDIAEGEGVIKYGAPIGSATRAIRRGEIVHLHNMKSDYLASHARGGAVATSHGDEA